MTQKQNKYSTKVLYRCNKNNEVKRKENVENENEECRKPKQGGPWNEDRSMQVVPGSVGDLCLRFPECKSRQPDSPSGLCERQSQCDRAAR